MEESILTIPFNNKTPITDDTDLYIICKDIRDNPILEQADNRFYRSYICEKNTVVVNSERLFVYNIHQLKLPEKVTVLILPSESCENLVFDYVRNIAHFTRYLQFAERSMCNLRLLEDNVALDGIFINMERKNEKMWKVNKVLLTNIGYREFAKMHFEGPAPAAALNGGYPDFNPLRNPKLRKYLQKVRFEPIKSDIYNSLCTQESFDWMIAFLIKLNLQLLTQRIMRAFLLSMEYCHLAIKCPYLKNIVAIYPEISGYMIYAMRVLYLEERSKFGGLVRAPTLTHSERVIFTLEDVEGLPYYSTYTPDNPYFIEPGFGMTHKQQLTLPAFMKGPRGIYTREEATERMLEYTGGILEQIVWNHKGVRTALCGSAIPAIFIQNVLENYVEERADYFQEYYPANTRESTFVDVDAQEYEKPRYVLESDDEASSEDPENPENATRVRRRRRRVQLDSSDSADNIPAKDESIEEPEPQDDPNAPPKKLVDIDLSGKPNAEELERAHAHLMRIRGWRADESGKISRGCGVEIQQAERSYEESKRQYEKELMKKMPHGFTKKDDKGKEEADEIPKEENEDLPFIDNKLTESEKLQDKYTDIDLMIETDDYELFDEIAEMHFAAIKASLPEHSTLHPDPNSIYMKLLYTENKYKYKIYGLPRPVEMFMVNSIPGTISKFHLAPVRAWWDGNNLHMLPTFITAAMTSVCFDMRWISCAKDLRDIVLKYFQRGFAPLMNKDEARNIITYINASPKWPTWIMPANWGGWRAERWNSRPIFFKEEGIFNPSKTSKGIYHGLKTNTVQVVNKIDFSIKISKWSGVRIPKSVSRSLLRKKIVNPSKVAPSWATAFK